MFDTTSQET